MNLKETFCRSWHTYMLILVINIICFESVQAADKEFGIDKIITAIKREIQRARAIETGLPRFKINSVNIELAVTTTKTAGGGISINVAGFGVRTKGGIDKANTQRLKLIWKPVGDITISDKKSLGLVEAIEEVKKAVRRAYNKSPRFQLDEFTFEIEFIVEKNVGAGISFLFVDLADVKAKNLATQKVKINMSIVK